ncbi:MAG TPA: DUF5010 domain-containing protein [Polyangiaceae bacterium]|jgi:hypothetical protein|nr:DUF5010 domain-containing protein [Polyangiaceae bacterium]
MARRIAKLNHRARSALGWIVLLTPAFAACSFFAPSLDEYARSRGGAGGAGGQGQAGQDSAGNGGTLATAGTGGGTEGGDANTNAGSGGASGEGGAQAGAPGEAGWAGAVTVGQVVAPSDVALQAVITRGLPEFGALTGYGATEANAAQTDPPRDAPTYKPYDSLAPAWWDDLVAEQLQARVTTVLFPTHGAYSLTATDMTGPDAMNPRRLAAWVSALDRAGASGLFQAACFVDMPSLQAVSNNLHAQPAGTIMDLSVASDWNDVIWLRGIKPWFDTIPSTSWHTLRSNPDSGVVNPLIEFGSLPASSFSNGAGHLSTQLSALATAFQSAYNSYPNFVLDSSWFTIEPGLSSNRYVIGKNNLITQAPSSAAFTTYQGLTVGTAVPGFTDPTYYSTGDPKFHDASLVIPRHTTDSYGTEVVTLVTGLAAGVQNQAQLTVLQNFTDLAQWSGFYRSSAKDWHTPSEYLNLVRRYSDPQTVTLRLEAEGCDKYSDTTPGNSAGAFLRSGDLDVRSLNTGSGWAVTNTAAGEWLEFDQVDFSAGNYKFVIKYSTSGSASIAKRIQLLIDGERLTPIIASNTVNADAFGTTLLAEHVMPHGPHDLRVRFIDGLVDLDWLFVLKTSPVLSLQASGGTFMSAREGGGSTVTADAAKAAIFERFTFDDLNGGTLADGDQVYLQTFNGMYLSVEGGVLTAAQRTPGTPETFTVHGMSAGDITSGSTLALATSDGKHYLTVGAGSAVDGTGTSIGTAQTFTVGLY